MDTVLIGVFFFLIPKTSYMPLLTVVVSWLYFAAFESSALQATPGKHSLGLFVESVEGVRVSFLQASLRFFLRFFSAFIFYTSYLLIFFTKRRQGLHDVLSGCVVRR